ncbi:hypothetical protein SEUCBS139899_009938 [Sporothrix eucalyptigena]
MAALLLLCTAAKQATAPVPSPEPIAITELPLPPVLANTSVGACTKIINPHRTGCISQTGLFAGSFLPDSKHVLATVEFVGAPAAPDPASIYTGVQLFIVKTDNTTFRNGDSWKCITCGVPAANQVGATDLSAYPQTFLDGTRAMAGTNIIDCGKHLLASDSYTPDQVHVYPIRLSNTADYNGTGTGTALRELRIHPDQVHLGFDTFVFSGASIGEYSYFGRLQFNQTGLRYDVVNTSILVASTNSAAPLRFNGSEVVFDPEGIAVGELRGFSSDGSEILYVGYPVESCNIDLFAIGITSGKSYDNKWQVVLDTRDTNRMMFLSALRSVPPMTDLLTVGGAASVRNNGARRFFRPWLLDHDGDRDSRNGWYFGQQINGDGTTTPGGTNDPYWNAGANPRWSPDGRHVVYYEMFAVSPACGSANTLPCEANPYVDGRQVRIMLATLTSPWATKYTPGMTISSSALAVGGDYTLYGTAGDMTIFTNDGANFLNGHENVTTHLLSTTLSQFDWYSDLASTGPAGVGTKKTSADGFHFQIDVLTNEFEANGTMTTVIDDMVFEQPCNGC